MNGFISPEYFIQMIKQGKNPEQLMMDFLQRQMGDSPLVNLAQKRDAKGIEQFARNYYKQQGKDFDKEFQMFRQMFGL
jgi:hypothetical protein